jgi:hypothetical protein
MLVVVREGVSVWVEAVLGVVLVEWALLRVPVRRTRGGVLVIGHGGVAGSGRAWIVAYAGAGTGTRRSFYTTLVRAAICAVR